jgi:hypothetical protein
VNSIVCLRERHWRIHPSLFYFFWAPCNDWVPSLRTKKNSNNFYNFFLPRFFSFLTTKTKKGKNQPTGKGKKYPWGSANKIILIFNDESSTVSTLIVVSEKKQSRPDKWRGQKEKLIRNMVLILKMLFFRKLSKWFVFFLSFYEQTWSNIMSSSITP